MLKLGIDVGGTNTDAALLTRDNRLVGAVKRPTTTDIEGGIGEVLDALLADTAVEPEAISHVMLGTTHAANAVIRRRDLARVGLVRICLPAGQAVDPFATWPEDLRAATGATARLVHGGYEFDGSSLHRGGLKEEECRRALRELREQGTEALAICGIYSLVRDDQERTVAAWAAEELGPEIPVTLSSEIASLGLLERENAACLNAALVRVARRAARALQDALGRRGIDAEVYFTQNDGTLMSLELAERYPVFTISSGPTNSIRGAAFLSGLTDCLVVDVGGTSTDVGALVHNFPRESALAVEIGEVRTNFRMPDIYSIGLGGGSLVCADGDDRVAVGPDSVGHELPVRARAWGGTELTATDVAVAGGRARIDDGACDPARVSELDQRLVQRALARVDDLVADACDRMRTSEAALPVVLVGGGSVLVADQALDGLASEVVRPPHFPYANAIGAAIAQVSGQLDRMWDLDRVGRADALAEAKQLAAEAAVSAGADPDTVELVDVEEVPLAYLPSNALRIRVKAAGRLAIASS